MNLQSVGFTGAQVLTANDTSYNLSTPTLLNQRNVFRKVFGLRVSTGGLADGIRFDAAAAQLSVEFKPKELDIAGTSAVDVQAQSGGLAIELPVPMQVRRARLTGGTTTTVEIYRLDGDEIAEDATKSIANSTSSTVSGDFTDRRLALKQRRTDGSYESLGASDLKDLVVKGFPTAPRVGIAPVDPNVSDPLSSVFFFFNPGGIADVDEDLGPQLAEVLQQHVDSLEAPFPAHVDVYLVFESDAPCEVVVKSFAVPVFLVRSSFRAVLFDPEDFTAAAAFATRLQEHSTPLTSFLRGKLSANTSAALDRAGKTVATRVLEWLVRDLNSAIQSEAIYSTQRFQGVALTPETLAAAQAAPAGVARTRVNRKLLEEAFPQEIAPVPEPSGDEKEVLRAAGATSSLDVTVDFPRNALVSLASLKLDADLSGDAPGGTGSSSNGDGTGNEADLPDELPDTVGLFVDTGRSIARLISPDAALDASGIALALSATAASTELTAEIRADDHSTPAGRVIAAGRTAIAQLDRPGWIHFAFKKAAVVEAGPHWLVLRATNGSAVWLAEEASATTRVGDSSENGWTDRGGFGSIAPLFQVWARGGDAAAAAPDGSDPLTARLRVLIGSTSVPPTPALVPGAKTRTFNITAAIQAWLAAQPSAPGITAIPIRIVAVGKGGVTVYPPVIEYSL